MKILKNIIILLVIIIILISSFIIVINKDKITIKYLVIKSGSMYPTFDVGDIIIIKKENQYEVGDIITYNYYDKYLITHRIIDLDDDNIFITKGDNNNSEDEECVTIDNIVGKTIFIINREMKYFIIISINIVIIYILWKGNKNEKNN